MKKNFATQLRSSMESHCGDEWTGEPINADEAFPHTPDAVEFAEQLEVVNGINKQLDEQHTKANALESLMVALESQQGPMSPFEAQMFATVVEHAGLTMPQLSPGMGLEAYSSNRSTAMYTIALEGFKEQFMKVVEFVLGLLRKLKEVLKKILDFRMLRVEHYLEVYRKYIPGKGPRKSSNDALHEMQIVSSIANGFTLDNKFDVDAVITNTVTVVKSLSDPQLAAQMNTYTQSVTKIVAELLKDAGNWRRYVEGVNKLQVPVPACFEKTGQSIMAAKFVSPRLFNNTAITYDTVAGDNNHGARGARERAAALAKVGPVNSEAYHSSSSNRVDVSRFVKTDISSTVSKIVAMLTDTKSMLKTNRQAQQLNQTEQQLKAVRGKDAVDVGIDVISIVNHLIMSIGAISKANTDLVNRVAQMSINTASRLSIFV